MKVSDLVKIAKRELVEETKDLKLIEIKTRLKEIIAAEKTIAMLKAQYEKRLVEIEDEIKLIETSI